MTERIERIVVFTSDPRYSVEQGVRALAEAFPDVSLLVMRHRPHKPLSRLVRNQVRNLRINGWRWIPYQVADIAARLGARLRRSRACGAVTGSGPAARLRPPAVDTVEVVSVDDVHGAASLARVREFAPDLGISLAAPILKESLFAIPRLGTLNLHKGKVPHYRGMPPAFWELHNGEREVGCTVHKVESKLDTGAILLEASVPVQKHSTVRGMQILLDELGVTMVCDAVRLLSRGEAQWREQPAGGKTYRKPTLQQQRVLERRLRTAPRGSPARRLLKEAFFWGHVHVKRPVARRRLAASARQRVVVLLYHRVSDEMRDAVTVGIEQFDRQMEFLARNYPVVDVCDLIRGDYPRDADRPVIAITFDDGYRDNYEHAAPILVRHRLPCAFFVSTGRIGNDTGFEHDHQKLGRTVSTMSWAQVEEMHRAGFTIGSHTVTHIDCGSAPLDRIVGELVESRDTLREKLGLDDVVFAYPFGGRHNMTPAVLAEVEKVGYTACLSAYGGFNDAPLDLFDIKRSPVSYAVSPRGLRARLEGLAV